jgi:hypothetical protein
MVPTRKYVSLLSIGKNQSQYETFGLRFDIHILMKLKQHHTSFDYILKIHIIEVTSIRYESTLSEQNNIFT